MAAVSYSHYKAFIDIFLAQAETFKRLGRTRDAEQRILAAKAWTVDFRKAIPDPSVELRASLLLTRGQIARVEGNLDAAAEALDAAATLTRDADTRGSIGYEMNLVTREREIAGGSLQAMVENFVVYVCQQCGMLIEYISLPCWWCEWRPTTLMEVGCAAKLSLRYLSCQDLLSIGRQIREFHRKITDIAPGLSASVERGLGDRNSSFRQEMVSVLKTGEEKNNDNCVSWREAAVCGECGAAVLRFDLLECVSCHGRIALPPPLRLLLCLQRIVIHLIHNVGVPGGEAGRPTQAELFVAFLCAVTSKLTRTQETPSDRERSMVQVFMTELKRFALTDGLGAVEFADSKQIAATLASGMAPERAEAARAVLRDLRDALQYLSDWMRRPKVLC